MTAIPRLHILGCGRAARVMARWLLEAGQVDIGQICNRTLDSARSAVDFIGRGDPVERMDSAVTGGWLLLGLPDGEIGAAALGLACRMPGQPELAFHLSGSMPAAMLRPLGTAVASVHPARAFARPEQALSAMSGTWCVGEGDEQALARLEPAMVAAGGRWLMLPGPGKALYHASTVVASNFLVSMTGLARQLADAAGLQPAAAIELLHDLQMSTLDNLCGQPAASVLTGPIERGDERAMACLLEQLDQVGPAPAAFFRAMSLATLELAITKRGKLPNDQAMRQLFTSRTD